MICGNCRANHDTAAEVRSCFGNSGQLPYVELPAPTSRELQQAAEASTSKATERPMSEKQTNLLKALIRSVLVKAGEPVATLEARVEETFAKSGPRDIDSLKAAGTKPVWESQAQRVATITDLDALNKGDIHVHNGVYLRIHISQGTGRPYAVRAVVHEHALWEDGTCVQPGEVEWVYQSGLTRDLSEKTLATADEAKAFAQLAGRCVFCSTPIDTPESTAVGYGPVCAKRRGLPWGSTTEVTTQTRPEHEDPCRCGTYDRCWGVRVASATSQRDLFRAYND